MTKETLEDRVAVLVARRCELDDCIAAFERVVAERDRLVRELSEAELELARAYESGQ